MAKTWYWFATVIVWCGCVYTLKLTVDVEDQSAQRTHLARDLAELEHVKYGLFDAGRWAEIGSQVALKKVDEFEITEDRRRNLLPVIESALYKLLNAIEDAVGRLSTMKQQVATIALKSHLDARKVPSLARDVLKKIEEQLAQPETRGQLRALIAAELDRLRAETETRVDRSILGTVLKAHDCTDRITCRGMVAQQIDELRARMQYRVAAIILFISALTLLITFGLGVLRGVQIIYLSIVATILWYGGITMPMLAVEAKLGELHITLAGEPFSFANQLVFYQSKSVLDFVMIMVRSGQIDVIIVGGLIGLFSVIFPVLKLLATVIHIPLSKRSRSPAAVRFFALKSSKWSMADVMVVSIFMAYIGFSRLIETQLGQIGTRTPQVDVLVTNGTQLQVGFYFFAAFCLLGLMISTLAERLPSTTKERAD